MDCQLLGEQNNAHTIEESMDDVGRGLRVLVVGDGSDTAEGQG